MLTFDELHAFAASHCSTPVTPDVGTTPRSIQVSLDDILVLARALHGDPATYFDVLSCLTGIDNGVEAGTMEVVYNLYSIPFDHHVMVKVTLPRDHPQIDSVSSVWRTAEWHEREAFDLFGIVFRQHPDLRRILLPADWQGYPLRKDYKHQEYYRDIRVEY